MTILDSLCQFIGTNRNDLSHEESQLLDALLIHALCKELAKIYRETKNMISNKSIINLILQDLIRTNDYTISGVATYTNLPEEVIYDIAIGKNNNPTLEVSRKIIELHRGARTTLYKKVMEKITATYTKSG